jgi:hypothetical protein
MRKFFFEAITSATFFLTSTACVAQTPIIVRLLNGKTYEPLPERPILLFLGSPTVPGTHTLRARTDEKGVAQFALPDPAPKTVFVDPDPGLVIGCSHEDLDVAEVLRAGVTAQNLCAKPAKPTGLEAAKPGEIVEFAKPLTFWERLKREAP